VTTTKITLVSFVFYMVLGLPLFSVLPPFPSPEQLWEEEEEGELFSYALEVISLSEGAYFHEKEYKALTQKLSPALGNYYLVQIFEGYFLNSGAQAVLITDIDDLDVFAWKLERIIEAYRYFGATRVPAILESHRKKILLWNQQILELNAKESETGTDLSPQYEPVWAKFDALDDPIYEAIGEDFTSGAIYEMIRKHPSSFREGSDRVPGREDVSKPGPAWGKLALSFLALWYGSFSVLLRLKRPGLFWKLSYMQHSYGKRLGTAIHVFIYTVLPLIYGMLMFARAFQG